MNLSAPCGFENGVGEVDSLYPAVLLRRYKRFLADVRLADGSEITIHCPNTGSMKNCVVVDGPCWYSVSPNKTRKYPQTLEIVTAPGGHWAGINTGRANQLVAAALEAGVIKELLGYKHIQREQVYGDEKSRIDFLLTDHCSDKCACYLEVKNLTLMEAEGEGYFPDAVSARGTKHLRELKLMVARGQRAVLLFCVQHTGIRQVSPADHIDKLYADTLREVKAAGVEVIAYGVPQDASLHPWRLVQPLPVVC
ncbi:DNA/RNA nuclease SfsA [Cellvibrio fontiphilus]|uniref:Sugar fermentation stimulation protein homolog n=1 Tax=Cellvibrio fontiphilus TaxID=1815559 RepID=A0ABV7FIV9_9GAMM